MKRFRLLALILIMILLTGMVSAASAPVPYAIRVNRAANTVTIYGLDEAGQHTVPVKAMICSTARPGYVTPLGSYQLAAYRSAWRLMLDGTYGQYATCFRGNYLFHSICYADDSHDAMVREAYNALGTAASMGCVRLETADAKWIYDNCPAGTPVTIYDDADDPGPLGKPARTVDHISEEFHTGWDPTDPAAGNPWRDSAAQSLALDAKRLTMTAGEAAALHAAVEPQNVLLVWDSSDETVATVDMQGHVTALSAGTAEIRVSSHNGVSAVCTVEVEGELLPFSDLTPGAWYYPEIRRAVELGLFRGSGGKFSPQDTMTRAMVVQVLYNLAGQPKAPAETGFSDVNDGHWYRDAAAWAAENGIVKGLSGSRFAPDQPMTRQELAVLLWRYAGAPAVDPDLDAFSDHDCILSYAESALAWAVSKDLLQGSGGRLLPDSTLTRAETAAIFQRFAAS